MNRKLLAPLALAAILVLAGCTGGGGNATTTDPGDTPTSSVPTTTAAQPTEDPTTTDTTADEPGTTTAPVTPDPSIPADAYPPGASAEGITNATTLVKTHNQVLLRNDFTSTTNTTLIEANQSGATRSVEISELRVDVDNTQAIASLFSSRSRGDRTSTSETTAFANGTHIASRTVQANQTGYNVGPVQSFNSTVGFGNRLRGILQGSTFVPVAASQEGDRTFIRYELTDFDQSDFPDSANVERLRGSLVVDDRGLVRDLTFQIRVTNVGLALVDRTFTLSVAPGEVSVERPDWIQTAFEEGQ